MKSYLFKKMDKDELKKVLKGSSVSKKAAEIGVSRCYLSRVFNRWNTCSKFCAYAITKSLDSEKEIEDFFEIKILH